jgi:hypothetical protein
MQIAWYDAFSLCRLSIDEMWCETHECGSLPPEQCGRLGCPHCEGMQRLIGVLPGGITWQQ